MSEYIAFEPLDESRGVALSRMPSLQNRERAVRAMPLLQTYGAQISRGRVVMPTLQARNAAVGRMPILVAKGYDSLPVNDATYGVAFLSAPRTSGSASLLLHASSGAYDNIMPALRRPPPTNALPGLRTFGVIGEPVVTFVSMFQTPGLLYAEGGAINPFLIVDDAASASDTVFGMLGLVFSALALATDQPSADGAPTSRRADIAAVALVADRPLLLTYAALADAVLAADSNDLDVWLQLTMADVLEAADLVSSWRSALAVVAAVAKATDAESLMSFLDHASAAQTDDSLDAMTYVIAHMVDEAVAADTAVALRFGAIFVGDAAVVSDANAALRAGMMGLLDVAFVGGKFTFDGIDYTIYAMTTLGTAITEYAGLRFNSFAVAGGKTYAAGPDGIHVLEGDTDNGAPVESKLQIGLSTLGTQLYKAVPAVYIGYTSTGAMMCKTVTTESGIRKENWYKMNPVPRGSNAGGRFTPSKGLHSQYWGFELENVDGADFDLDLVQVWRMALTRRKR